MAVLPILTADSPTLRQKAKRVNRLDGALQKFIDDMVETMHAARGVGLAAPQVGVGLRLAVIQLPPEQESPMAGQLIVLCNPEIVKAEGEWEPDEGCLSLPGWWGQIKRAQKVTVKARDRHGKAFRIKGQGLLAQALQHEIDHLNGVLFFDHLPSLDLLRRVEPQPQEEKER